jgi:two-component system, NtrC family, nitrogen regulation response regulator GlnG
LNNMPPYCSRTEQYGNGSVLVANSKNLDNNGFTIAIEDILKKHLEQLETIDPGKEQPVASGRRIPCLTIACHPDTSRIGERLLLFGPKGTSPIALSRTGPAFSNPSGRQTGPLASLNLSRKPLKVSPGNEGGVVVGAAPGGSLLEIDGQRVDGRQVISRDAVEAGVVLTLAQRVVLLLHIIEDREPCSRQLGLVGHSDRLEKLRDGILQVSGKDAPVLLLGESGAGKELVARAIHRSGPRKERSFVAVNLAAVPASVAASELFGHKSGAFTGADRNHLGYFEQANGGTLFLDEVGAAEPQLQSVLLRVLETGEFQPLGSRTSKRVDVRVIAATDADLDRAVAAGQFRAPLYHRLASYLLRVPPLRERRDDIGRLLVHFLVPELEKVGAGHRLEEPPRGKPPWLPAALVSDLVRHEWPGNVRELANLVRRMVAAFHHKDAVDPSELLGAKAEHTAAPEKKRRPWKGSVAEEDLIAAMREHKWSIGATARQLGISRNTLYSLIEQSPAIRLAKDLSPEEISQASQECGGDIKAAAEKLEVSVRALKLHMKKLQS